MTVLSRQSHRQSSSFPLIPVGLAIFVACVLLCAAVAAAAGGSQERRIVPGKSIGYARLGMTREAVEHKLSSPLSPKRTQKEGHYSLTYRYPYRAGGNSGGTLSIVFRGLGVHSPAAYMVTVEPSLGTQPADVGVGDGFYKMLGNYPGVFCYHSEADGSRNENIEQTDNFECELKSNGGFTYFAFASLDADPRQRIGAIAVSSIKID